MNANAVKSFAKNLGVDLCGIAPVNRFADTPKGFRPTGVYKLCKSFVVFTKKIPEASLVCGLRTVNFLFY